MESKLKNKLIELINETSEDECLNIEYSMELVLKELNSQYLEELVMQRDFKKCHVMEYEEKIRKVEKTIEELDKLNHLN